MPHPSQACTTNTRGGWSFGNYNISHRQGFIVNQRFIGHLSHSSNRWVSALNLTECYWVSILSALNLTESCRFLISQRVIVSQCSRICYTQLYYGCFSSLTKLLGWMINPAAVDSYLCHRILILASGEFYMHALTKHGDWGHLSLPPEHFWRI